MTTGDKLSAKLPHLSASTIARNPGLFGRSIAGTGLAPVIPAGKRIRQDQKPLMNKLETEFAAHLVVTHPEITKGTLRAQAKRFRLGNGNWYKPDFTGMLYGREFAWEVKGPKAFRGGFENLKVAATTFQEISWFLVWKEDGAWKQQHVLP